MTAAVAAADAAAGLWTASLSLPSMIYAVQGQEQNVYFENVIRRLRPDGSTHPDDYDFDVTCQYGGTPSYVGQQQSMRWTANPIGGDVGDQSFTLDAYFAGQKAATATSTLRVRGTTASPTVTRKFMYAGDSTGSGGQVLSELVRLGTVGSLTVTTVGSIQTANVADSTGVNRTVNHASVSGMDITTLHTSSAFSPFVISGVFNFAQYLTNNSITMAANDWFVFALGINDMLGQTSDAGVVSKCASVKTDLDAMIANIRAAVSGIRIGLAMTIPPAGYQEGFGANYQNGMTRWRYARNNALFREWLIANYDTALARSANQFVFDIGANLDLRNNMQASVGAANSYNAAQLIRQANGVHPATTGYYQIAGAIYAFLRGQET